jgi:hypothetical protein
MEPLTGVIKAEPFGLGYLLFVPVAILDHIQTVVKFSSLHHQGKRIWKNKISIKGGT